MRLYLSSYKVGNRPDELLRLLGSNQKIAVIKNAGDFAGATNHQKSVE